MQKWNIDSLRCPRCYGKFGYNPTSINSGLLECKCSQYPLMEGIAYISQDPLRSKAAGYLKKGDEKGALFSLIDLKRRTRLPAAFLLTKNLINTISKWLLRRPFYRVLGFERVVSILTIFFFSKEWASYIKARKITPSFVYSVAATNLLKGDSQTVVDLGCGTGQLLGVLGRKTNPRNVFGVDKSFFSLLLARRFFCPPKTLLVCADIEKDLPFKTLSVDLVLSTDSFHYVIKKDTFLKECFRIVKSRGFVAALHIVNKEGVVFKNIRGIVPNTLSKILRKAGFGYWTYISNASLWKKINGGGVLTLKRSDPRVKMQNCFAYGFFAGKRRIVQSISLTAGERRELKKGQIDLMADKALIHELNLNTTLDKYSHFIFLSPHLDDAVLSCGLLLEKLKLLDKKIHVISIFTKASGPPWGTEAKLFLQKTGYTSAEKLFKARALEDLKALSIFNAGNKHLGYIDAAFRSVENSQNLLYPTPQHQFSGTLSNHDQALFEDVLKDLKKMAVGLNKSKTLMLAPLAIGGHADHVLVRDVSRRLRMPVLYWSDFPYNTHKSSVEKFFLKEKIFGQYFKIESFEKSLKNKAIRSYTSQIPLLFPKRKIPEASETYFIANKSKARVNPSADFTTV